MSITVSATEKGCRIVFEGNITFEHSRELEDQIISTLRQYRHLEIDLSGIRDIDLCGIHLLGLVHQIGGENAVVVANSDVVQLAFKRLLVSYRDTALRGDRRERRSVAPSHDGGHAALGAAQPAA